MLYTYGNKGKKMKEIKDEKEGMANYHSHTYLCHHAEGRPLDYAREAKKYNLSEIGISCHCPYPLTFGDYWPSIRMAEEEVPAYLQGIKEAESKTGIRVLTSFECEFDDNYKNYYQDILKGKYKAAYLVLGSHWVTLGVRHLYVLEIKDKSTLFLYIKQTLKAIETGLFTFIAHPDIFISPFLDWDSDIQAASKDLIECCISKDIALEINGLGLKMGLIKTKQGFRYHYPYKEFWQLVKELGGKVIANSDAHKVANLVMDKIEAEKYASELGISTIKKLAI